MAFQSGHGQYLLPAYAGMIPVLTCNEYVWTGAPRVCGDDPAYRLMRTETAQCSPRMRG